VFLSQPDGTYRFEPLPRIAQISPSRAWSPGDFDGDGNADIYAVQNSYAPIPSVGRFDGGLSQLLLRGDGRGGFTPVPPPRAASSCPATPRPSRSPTSTATAGPDFLVTRNNGTTLAFRNGGRGRPPVLLRPLRGAAGQPDGRRARASRSNSPTARRDERGLRGLGLLQPVRARLLLRLLRHQSRSLSTLVRAT
jgi:enediyne biosynthesis protein E4